MGRDRGCLPRRRDPAPENKMAALHDTVRLAAVGAALVLVVVVVAIRHSQLNTYEKSAPKVKKPTATITPRL